MYHTTEIKGGQRQSLAAHTVWPGGPHWKGPCQHIPCVTGSRNVYCEGRGATASAIHHVGVFCKLVCGCFNVQPTLPLGSLHHQHTWGNLPEHAKTLTFGLSVSDLEQSFKFPLSFSVTKWKWPKHPHTAGPKRRHESRNEGRGLGSVGGQFLNDRLTANSPGVISTRPQWERPQLEDAGIQEEGITKWFFYHICWNVLWWDSQGPSTAIWQ